MLNTALGPKYSSEIVECITSCLVHVIFRAFLEKSCEQLRNRAKVTGDVTDRAMMLMQRIVYRQPFAGS